MTKRLPPMIDDPSQPPYVRELLQAGRDFKVADYDVARGLDKHLAHIATGTAAPPWAHTLQPGTGAAGAAAAAGSLAPWVVLPLVTAAVVAAVVIGTGSEPVAPRPLPSAPLAAPQPADSVAARAAEQVEAVPQLAADDTSGRVVDDVARVRRPTRPARTASHAGKRTSAVAATRSAKLASPSGAGAETASLPLKTAATREAGEGAELSHRANAQPAEAAEPEAPIAIEDPKPAAEAEPAEPPARPEPVVQDDARLEREMAMLAMSQRVLHTDPARALKLARQGEAEFAASMFTQERQQLLLLALVKLGRLEEAKRLAKPYLARYPKGPFSDRVRRALATGRVER